MMKIRTQSLLLCSALLFSMPSLADTESDVLEVVVDNFKALDQEDVPAYMDTIHTQSLMYKTTENALNLTFRIYDLEYDLQKVSFIGADDKYAYVKVVFETRKLKGPAFQNNQIEALIVFKQDNGEWKMWSQANLQLNKVNAKVRIQAK